MRQIIPFNRQQAVEGDFSCIQTVQGELCEIT